MRISHIKIAEAAGKTQALLIIDELSGFTRENTSEAAPVEDR